MTENTPTEAETNQCMSETGEIYAPGPDDESVFVVTYFNRYPDDGFELGGVYPTRDAAAEAAETHDCADYGWANYAIAERAIGGDN